MAPKPPARAKLWWLIGGIGVVVVALVVAAVVVVPKLLVPSRGLSLTASHAELLCNRLTDSPIGKCKFYPAPDQQSYERGKAEAAQSYGEIALSFPQPIGSFAVNEGTPRSVILCAVVANPADLDAWAGDVLSRADGSKLPRLQEVKLDKPGRAYVAPQLRYNNVDTGAYLYGNLGCLIRADEKASVSVKARAEALAAAVEQILG